jgi:hypothetical protein
MISPAITAIKWDHLRIFRLKNLLQQISNTLGRSLLKRLLTRSCGRLVHRPREIDLMSRNRAQRLFRTRCCVWQLSVVFVRARVVVDAPDHHTGKVIHQSRRLRLKAQHVQFFTESFARHAVPYHSVSGRDQSVMDRRTIAAII